MKISREFKIKNLIIKKEDIKRLVQLVQSEYNALSQNSSHMRMLFKGSTEGNIIFESTDPDDFLSAELMQTKRTKTFDCSLIDYTNDLSLYISLSHGSESYSRNFVSVQGTDSNWVNSLIERIKDSVEASRPQNSFVGKYKTLLIILSALGIGQLYDFFLNLFLVPFLPDSKISISSPALISIVIFFRAHHFFALLLGYFMNATVGLFPSYYLISKAERLWPSIEFQIGPLHTHIEKKRRNIIYTIFCLGILPLLLSIIYEFLKPYL